MQPEAIPNAPHAAGVVHPTPDMSNFLAAHESMRRSNQKLVDGVADTTLGDSRRVKAIQKWFAGYAGELRTHHRNEDEIFFPAMARKVAIFAEYEQSLADDHHDLHHLLERIDASLAAWTDQPSSSIARDRAQVLLVELRDMLLEHLAIEDRDILPLFERHITVEELAELDAQMLKDLELKQAFFTVPWIINTVDDQQRNKMWELATTPLKVIYYLTNRRYCRLTVRAFGAQP